MKKLLLCLSVLGLTVSAHAERVVFEQSKNKVWSDYKVQSITYFKKKNNGVGIGVWLGVRDVFPPTRIISPPPDRHSSYLDSFEVKGLSFDPTISKRGAVVYNDGVTKT